MNERTPEDLLLNSDFDELQQVYHLAMNGDPVSYEGLQGTALALRAGYTVEQAFDEEMGRTMQINALMPVYERNKYADELLPNRLDALQAAATLRGLGAMSVERVAEQYFAVVDKGINKGDFIAVDTEDEDQAVLIGAMRGVSMVKSVLGIAISLENVGVPDMQKDIEQAHQAVMRHLGVVIEKHPLHDINMGVLAVAYAAVKDWYDVALANGVDVTDEAELLLQKIAAQAETAVAAEDRAAGIHAAVDLAEYKPKHKPYRRQVRQLANKRAVVEAFKFDQASTPDSFEYQAYQRLGQYGLLGFLGNVDAMNAFHAAMLTEEDRLAS